MVLCVRPLNVQTMEDGQMDESRVNTLRTEIRTLEDEMSTQRPDDAGLDYILGKVIAWSFRWSELMELHIVDLRDRVAQIEATLYRPSSSDRTESPPTQP